MSGKQRRLETSAAHYYQVGFLFLSGRLLSYRECCSRNFQLMVRIRVKYRLGVVTYPPELSLLYCSLKEVILLWDTMHLNARLGVKRCDNEGEGKAE